MERITYSVASSLVCVQRQWWCHEYALDSVYSQNTLTITNLVPLFALKAVTKQYNRHAALCIRLQQQQQRQQISSRSPSDAATIKLLPRTSTIGPISAGFKPTNCGCSLAICIACATESLSSAAATIASATPLTTVAATISDVVRHSSHPLQSATPTADLVSSCQHQGALHERES